MNKLPIVILPGWMLEAKKYTQLKESLQKFGFTAYIVDFPGFTKDKPLTRVFTLTDYVVYLKHFIQQNKINKAVFLAHSFGGRVALKYLSQYPQKGEKLILSGTPGFINMARLKLIFFLIFAKIGGKFFSLPVLRIIKNFIRKLYYKIIGARDFYHTHGYMRETFKNIIREPLLDYMRKIKIPTLLLWGKQDKVVPVSVAKKMNKTMANSKLQILPDSNHMFVINNPQETAESVVNFINL